MQDGTPLLYDPASKGFSMICELLLENGTNPQTETRTGMSPLYISSKNGHKDVVRILLKFGADVTRVCMEVCVCVCVCAYTMYVHVLVYCNQRSILMASSVFFLVRSTESCTVM